MFDIKDMLKEVQKDTAKKHLKEILAPEEVKLLDNFHTSLCVPPAEKVIIKE